MLLFVSSLSLLFLAEAALGTKNCTGGWSARGWRAGEEGDGCCLESGTCTSPNETRYEGALYQGFFLQHLNMATPLTDLIKLSIPRSHRPIKRRTERVAKRVKRGIHFVKEGQSANCFPATVVLCEVIEEAISPITARLVSDPEREVKLVQSEKFKQEVISRRCKSSTTNLFPGSCKQVYSFHLMYVEPEDGGFSHRGILSQPPRLEYVLIECGCEASLYLSTPPASPEEPHIPLAVTEQLVSSEVEQQVFPVTRSLPQVSSTAQYVRSIMDTTGGATAQETTTEWTTAQETTTEWTTAQETTTEWTTAQETTTEWTTAQETTTVEITTKEMTTEGTTGETTLAGNSKNFF